MRQKIDVADVEAATKIRAKYLRALENEEFGLLPGNTFVKTFLRTYAEYLGLDPQLLLEEYRAEYEPRGDAEIQPYSVAARQRQRQRPRRQRSRAPSGPPGPGTALIVVAGVVVVILLILGLTSGSSKDQNASSPGSTTKTTPKAARPRRHTKPKPTTIKLRITPTTPTYVCVDRGANTPVVDQRTLTGQANYKGKHLRVNLGKSSVKVRVNRKLVSIPQGPQAVGYDFRLHSDGKVTSAPIPAGQPRPCG